jgi:hypothetical protein
MKRVTFLAFLLATAPSGIAVGHAAEGGPPDRATSGIASDQRTMAMRIRIKAGDKVVTATLVDNPTSRDFISLLPLTVTLEDHAATEKITYLPRKLSTEGAPAGSDRRSGTLHTMRLGGTWRCFTGTFTTRVGSSPWEGSMPA